SPISFSRFTERACGKGAWGGRASFFLPQAGGAGAFYSRLPANQLLLFASDDNVQKRSPSAITNLPSRSAAAVYRFPTFGRRCWPRNSSLRRSVDHTRRRVSPTPSSLLPSEEAAAWKVIRLVSPPVSTLSSMTASPTFHNCTCPFPV